MSGEDSTIGDGTGTSEGIDVSPDAVRQFSYEAGAEAQTFSNRTSTGMRDAQRGIGATFREAEYFSQEHDIGLQKLEMFRTDAVSGLTALGRGADYIATTYVNGDAASAATMSDVRRAFNEAKVNQLPAPEGGRPPVALPSPQSPNTPQPQ